MSGKNVNFRDKKIKKWLLQKQKVTKKDDIDVKEDPYGTKNSFKYFDGNTRMSFKISDKQLLKEYNQVWKKVEKLLKIKFDSEPVYGYNDKYVKTKTKIYAGSVNTNFQAKKCQKKKHHVSVYQ